MQAPLLAAITLHESGGGIAVVARLLWDVFRDQWHENAHLITMFDHENRAATFSEKARFTLAMRRAQVSGQTDWILFSHLALAQVQPLVPGRQRRRYAVFLHGIEAWGHLTAREAQLMANADIRIANSRYTAERVMQAHPEVGVVVPCPLALPIEAPSHHSSRNPSELPAVGSHAVIVVGRMLQSERYKGHDELLAAWPAVTCRVPDAQLVIVGEGDDVNRLKEKAANMSGVVFTGFVSRPVLNALYANAAIFALLSRQEGFGLVYLEAMRHGLPVIGSVHDAAADVVVDHVTGRLVNQDDVVSVAETISTLLLDDRKRREMGQAGFQRQNTEFTHERFKSNLCALLASCDDRQLASGTVW